MANYTKLFNSIVTSTIWTEDDKTRIVWITMLAICDQNGEVQASIPGLARLAGVTVEDAEMAIGKLLSPDKHSRTPDHEGRRIVPIDGGWELLNHAKYRRMASLEDRKEATAKRVRRHRERNADVTPCNANVTLLPDKAEAEAEAEAEADKREKTVLTKSESKTKVAIEIYKLYPKKVGKDAAFKAIVKAMSKTDAETLIEAVTAFAHAKKDADPQYIPNPATWFNQCRWEDDRATWIEKTRGQMQFGIKGQSTYANRNPKDSVETYEIPEL
jgi:hypothetical protein